jgi:hypothetical protein
MSRFWLVLESSWNLSMFRDEGLFDAPLIVVAMAHPSSSQQRQSTTQNPVRRSILCRALEPPSCDSLALFHVCIDVKRRKFYSVYVEYFLCVLVHRSFPTLYIVTTFLSTWLYSLTIDGTGGPDISGHGHGRPCRHDPISSLGWYGV